MDDKEIQFIRLWRSGDIPAAGQALQEWAALENFNLPRLSYWRAILAERLDGPDAANALLSPVIDASEDINMLCRFSRASNYIKMRNFDAAMQDLQAILDDGSECVAQTFHPACNFRMAYILATMGEPEYLNYASLVPDSEYRDFINGRLWPLSEIDNLFLAQKQMN